MSWELDRDTNTLVLEFFLMELQLHRPTVCEHLLAAGSDDKQLTVRIHIDLVEIINAIHKLKNLNLHCLKSVRIRSYSGPYFPAFGLNTESYGVYIISCFRPATLLKKRLWHMCIPVNFAKFLRKPFLQNTSGRLLLNYI